MKKNLINDYLSRLGNEKNEKDSRKKKPKVEERRKSGRTSFFFFLLYLMMKLTSSLWEGKECRQAYMHTYITVLKVNDPTHWLMMATKVSLYGALREEKNLTKTCPENDSIWRTAYR